MNGRFVDLMAAADFIGPGAVEVERYQTEIFDIVRRRGVFGQRIKQVPATGHPSRFFEETAIASPTAAQGFMDPRNIAPTTQAPTRVELAVPLKALVSQINYNLFDLEVTAQQSQFAYLQAKDLADAVDGHRHIPELADNHAIFRGDRADRSGGQHGDGREERGHDRADLQDCRGNDGVEFVVPGAADGDLCQSDAAGSDRPGDEDAVQRGAEHGGSHWRVSRESAVDAGRRSAADSGVGTGVHGDDRLWSYAASVHRDRGSDRVSLADRSEPASVQTRAAQCVDAATGGGEVWG